MYSAFSTIITISIYFYVFVAYDAITLMFLVQIRAGLSRHRQEGCDLCAVSLRHWFTYAYRRELGFGIPLK